MKTSERILEAATTLLDSGGADAVTLRAVGLASGVSHNAPYKHFKDRSALLAAIAAQDFRRLSATFTSLRQKRLKPMTRLNRALQAFSEYGRAYPHRYELLFSDPEIAKQGGELQEAATGSFTAFAELVADCQQSGELPKAPTRALAGLLYAMAHGLVDLHASGRMKPEKGFGTVSDGITLLFTLLGAGKAGGAKK